MNQTSNKIMTPYEFCQQFKADGDPGDDFFYEAMEAYHKYKLEQEKLFTLAEVREMLEDVYAKTAGSYNDYGRDEDDYYTAANAYVETYLAGHGTWTMGGQFHKLTREIVRLMFMVKRAHETLNIPDGPYANIRRGFHSAEQMLNTMLNNDFMGQGADQKPQLLNWVTNGDLLLQAQVEASTVQSNPQS